MIKEQYQIIVDHFERQAIEATDSYKKVKTHTTVETVEISVDLHRLAQVLGHIAINSKGGRSQECGGLIVVKHLRKKGHK